MRQADVNSGVPAPRHRGAQSGSWRWQRGPSHPVSKQGPRFQVAVDLGGRHSTQYNSQEENRRGAPVWRCCCRTSGHRTDGRTGGGGAAEARRGPRPSARGTRGGPGRLRATSRGGAGRLCLHGNTALLEHSIIGVPAVPALPPSARSPQSGVSSPSRALTPYSPPLPDTALLTTCD